MNFIQKIALCSILFTTVEVVDAQVKIKDTLKTKIILIGTGTPNPNPAASGQATAIVYGNRFFLFDAGAGIEQNLRSAKLSVKGPEATFFTHLHSDHTLGYPDLVLTSWVMQRRGPLEVFGPKGLQRMTDLLLDAYSEDIHIRITGLERELPENLKVNVHEINTGVVYDSAGVTVTAIPVLHGNWPIAYGYRIDTPDRSIVISGDTRPCDSLIAASQNVDVLIHEVYAMAVYQPEKRPGGEYWLKYLDAFHTSTIQLGQIAKKIKPKVLVLDHILRGGVSDETLISEIRKGGYTGKVIVGKDGEVF